MGGTTEYQVIESRDLTPDEKLWLDMRDEAIKQTPSKVSETITRLITLTTALAGGAIGVLKDDVCTGWGRVLAATFFFAALVAAVIGAHPRTAPLPMFPVDDIKVAIRKALGFKERCAQVAVVLLIVGILFAILGATARVA
jgi:hypothetical protein